MRRIFVLLVIFFGVSSVVHAEPPPFGPMTMTYEVYAGGFHALEATLTVDSTPSTYTITLDATPFGVIGNLLPWGGNYITHGIVAENILMPKTFDKTSRWKDDNDSTSFVYDNGKLLSQKENDATKKPPVVQDIPVTPELSDNAVDILTGTGQLLQQVNAGKSCSFSTIIYDGKRRYKLQFTEKGTEQLTTSDYNSFSGPAKICEVEMVPIAGFNGKVKGYYKIQEDARKKGQLPRVWLGRSFGYSGQNGPYIPVKMMVKSEYGAVLIHLKKVTR